MYSGREFLNFYSYLWFEVMCLWGLHWLIKKQASVENGTKHEKLFHTDFLTWKSCEGVPERNVFHNYISVFEPSPEEFLLINFVSSYDHYPMLSDIEQYIPEYPEDFAGQHQLDWEE